MHQAMKEVYENGIGPAEVEGVYSSDDVIAESLRVQLVNHVIELEKNPCKDWHPDSDETVRQPLEQQPISFID